MTSVMMYGGPRDGEIVEVPGNVEPDSYTFRLMVKRPFNPYGPPIDLETPIPIETVDLEIVPRISNSGPAWKIELPKELW